MNAQHIYTIDEVVHNFVMLLNGMDFAKEMKLLGIGRLHFVRRRKLTLELKSLCVGLWKLALQRSFPTDCDLIFNTFLTEQLMHTKNAAQTQAFVQKINSYVELLSAHRDTDFTVVGKYIVSFLNIEEKKAVALRLHLALQIRKLYSLIFDKLI